WWKRQMSAQGIQAATIDYSATTELGEEHEAIDLLGSAPYAPGTSVPRTDGMLNETAIEKKERSDVSTMLSVRSNGVETTRLESPVTISHQQPTRYHMHRNFEQEAINQVISEPINEPLAT